jgi:hypothetical protein
VDSERVREWEETASSEGGPLAMLRLARERRSRDGWPTRGWEAFGGGRWVGSSARKAPASYGVKRG